MQSERSDGDEHKSKKVLKDRSTYFAFSFIFIPVGIILSYTQGAGGAGIAFVVLGVMFLGWRLSARPG